jgi:general secretion pathway protein A
MYLDHYHLRLKPFQISTDPRFLWLGEKHKEALAVLKYGVLDNKGFLLLTGDVGTGKTTLLNALTDSLGDDTLVALVTDPGLAKMDFFNFVADSFAMDRHFKSKGEFLIYLRNYLHHIHAQNRRTLLIIDECQHLSQKLLEEVRLLSNIEKSNTKLINIFFVGQSEFNDIILRPRNRAIRQRITINYNISPLTESETADYIRFRLGVAGGSPSLFTSGAIKQVYQFSNGFPRLINIICDQALLTGYVQEKKSIDHKIVGECAGELKISTTSTHPASLATPESSISRPRFDGAKTKPSGNRVALASGSLNKGLLILAAIAVLILIGLAVTFMVTRQPSAPPKIETNRSPGDQPLPTQPIHPVSNATEDAVVDTPIPVPAPAQEEIQTDNPALTVSTDQRMPASTGQGSRIPEAARPTPEAEGDKPAERISLTAIKKQFGIHPEVQFDFNSNNLDEPEYEKLDLIARYCMQHPGTRLVLRGYTDKSGVRAYNIKLSEFRAKIVKTFLVGRGVSDSAIKTIAVGPDQDGPNGTRIPYDGKRRKVVIEIVAPSPAG